VTEETATYAFDVRDPYTGDGYAIYRCRECAALIDGVDEPVHARWHAGQRASSGAAAGAAPASMPPPEPR
jgi:hypothetical protein